CRIVPRGDDVQPRATCEHHARTEVRPTRDRPSAPPPRATSPTPRAAHRVDEQGLVFADSHDVYLVCHPFATMVGEFRSLLHALGDLDAHHLAGAEGFYRADLDTALVVLRFTLRAHRRLGDGLVEMLAGRSGIP